jgi:hypothetical protein
MLPLRRRWRPPLRPFWFRRNMPSNSGTTESRFEAKKGKTTEVKTMIAAT